MHPLVPRNFTETMTMKRLFSLMFLFVLVSLQHAKADGLVTLSGKVVDEAGEPLVGCVVRLKDSQVARYIYNMAKMYQLLLPMESHPVKDSAIRVAP